MMSDRLAPPIPLPALVLASASPRRQELLARLGLPFSVCHPEVDETPFVDESVKRYVQRMANLKAAWVMQRRPQPSVVIGADTIGELDGGLLLKPADLDNARAMLMRMSGRDHWVHTAVTIVAPGSSLQKLVSTKVRFRSLRAAEVLAYSHTGEGMDKAGAYAIQGAGAALVESIEGSYSAVVGLPLSEVADALQTLGYKCWQEQAHE